MKFISLLSILFIFSLSVFAQSPTPQSTSPMISAEAQKVIDANTPEALPQEPAAKREKTDAQDANLKGKVKTIISESEKPGEANSRYINWIEEYDKRGDLVKRIYFDWAKNPSTITVYGYIDGARVTRGNSIRHPYDPPPALAPPGAPGAAPPPKRDPRYQTKYEDKYANGKLSERLMYGNTGQLWTRTLYNWKDKDQVEILIYTSTGELNQKYTRRYDNSGDEIEQMSFDQSTQKYYGNRRTVTKYESYDKTGNWTKRTFTIKKVAEDGTETLVGSYASYRTITYHD